MTQLSGRHFRLIIRHRTRKDACWLSVPLDFVTASYGAAMYRAGGDDALVAVDTRRMGEVWNAHYAPHRLSSSPVATLLLVSLDAAPAPKQYDPSPGWWSRLMAKLGLVRKKGGPLCARKKPTG